jgi:hypothetical protein
MPKNIGCIINQEVTMQIILLSGWSQAGKDTAADLLVKVYGYQKFAFAEVPKIATAEKYNFPPEWAFTQEGKNLEIQTDKGLRKVRDLVIEYANGERKNNPQVWGEVIAKKIRESYKGKQTKFVISDWRFIDELVGLQKALYEFSPSIYPIQIRRSGQLISPVADNSEYSLLGFPFYMTIMNPGNKYFITNIGREMHEIISKD